MKGPFHSRPIEFTPDPLESGIPLSGVPNLLRQHSVGYNLQQEFETLAADLDLDLNLNDDASDMSAHSRAHHVSATPSSLHKSLFMPSRPQLAHEFSNFFGRERPVQLHVAASQPLALPLSFYPDMMVFTQWIENLSRQDTMTFVDHLCNTLPIDIVILIKLRMDSHLLGHRLDSGLDSRRVDPQQRTDSQMSMNSPIGSPNNPQVSHQPISLAHPMYQGSMDALTGPHLHSQPTLHQPKPKPRNPLTQGSRLFDKQARPKLAEPVHGLRFPVASMLSVGGTGQHAPQSTQAPQSSQLQSLTPYDRSLLPALHLFEKTNFLQLAAAGHSPLNSGPPASVPLSTGSTSFNASNLQYSVLAPHAMKPQGLQGGPHVSERDSQAVKLGALTTINSRVALDATRKYSDDQRDVISATPESRSPSHGSSQGLGQPLRLETSLPALLSILLMPGEVCNRDLLENIPAWLKLLRLHKYTDCLKDIPWKELVSLNDEQLEAYGVIALGARRKLLKAFDAVQKTM